jgi:hypothetical protein
MNRQPENYLAPVKALENTKPDAKDRVNMNLWLQDIMVYESFLGNYQQVLYHSNEWLGHGRVTGTVNMDTAFVKHHTLVNAEKAR